MKIFPAEPEADGTYLFLGFSGEERKLSLRGLAGLIARPSFDVVTVWHQDGKKRIYGFKAFYKAGSCMGAWMPLDVARMVDALIDAAKDGRVDLEILETIRKEISRWSFEMPRTEAQLVQLILDTNGLGYETEEVKRQSELIARGVVREWKRNGTIVPHDGRRGEFVFAR